MSARDRCEAWARKQLHVASDATQEDLRHSLWSRLSRQHQIPPQEIRIAFDYLNSLSAGQSPGTLPDHFLLHEETRLDQEVEAFAASMFQMPPQQRRERWIRLISECQVVQRPLVRCKSLAAGLDVDLNSLLREKEDVVVLAEKLCQVFVEAPPRQAAKRRAVCGLWKDESYRASRAAKRLLRRRPEFAALEPSLLKELTKAPELALLRLPSANQHNRDTTDSIPWGFLGLMVYFVIVLAIGMAAKTEQDRYKRQRDAEYQYKHDQLRQDFQRRLNETLLPKWKPSISNEELEEYLKESENSEYLREILRRNRTPAESSDVIDNSLESNPSPAPIPGSTNTQH